MCLSRGFSPQRKKDRKSALNTQQHTATQCSTLQCSATYCNTLQPTANKSPVVRDSIIYGSFSNCLNALHNTLQHNATHCKTHCNTLQRTAYRFFSLSLDHSLSTVGQRTHKQYTATHCNTLQHTFSLSRPLALSLG